MLLGLGMALSLLTGAFAPALPGSPVAVRVGAFALGVVCVVGLVVVMRPRASSAATGARPACPQCGKDLTDVPADAGGRTTCPGCEMSWAFGRDRAVWEVKQARTPTEASPQDTPTRSPIAGRVGRSRTRRRARRRAAARWTVVLFCYFMVTSLAVPALYFSAPWMNVQRAIYAALVLCFLLPLLIVAAGAIAVLRSGREPVAEPCSSCGYNLSGLDRTKPGGVVCPECGAQC